MNITLYKIYQVKKINEFGWEIHTEDPLPWHCNSRTFLLFKSVDNMIHYEEFTMHCLNNKWNAFRKNANECDQYLKTDTYYLAHCIDGNWTGTYIESDGHSFMHMVETFEKLKQLDQAKNIQKWLEENKKQ